MSRMPQERFYCRQLDGRWHGGAYALRCSCSIMPSGRRLACSPRADSDRGPIYVKRHMLLLRPADAYGSAEFNTLGYF